MAILEVVEMYEGRTGGVTDSGDEEATRLFSVETSVGTVGVADVLEADVSSGRIPRWGEPYVSEDGTRTSLRVRSINASPNKSPTLWRVEVKYSSRLDSVGGAGSAGSGDGGSGSGGDAGDDGGGEGGGPAGEAGASDGGGASGNPQQIENPLLRPASISYSTIKILRPVERAPLEDPTTGVIDYGDDPDYPGVAVVNTADMPFDPPLELEVSRLQMKITKNRALFDRRAIFQYVNCINEVGWAGFPRRTVRLVDVSAERQFENGFFFWSVTCLFEIKRSPWNPVQVLNAGFLAYKSGVTEHVPVTDSLGNRSSRPMPLDSSGYQIAKANLPDSIIYLNYHPYVEVDFKELRLFS